MILSLNVCLFTVGSIRLVTDSSWPGLLLSWQVELVLGHGLYPWEHYLGVVQQLLKSSIQCACLGTVLNLPMTEATLVENTIMLGMAFAMLAG